MNIAVLGVGLTKEKGGENNRAKGERGKEEEEEEEGEGQRAKGPFHLISSQPLDLCGHQIMDGGWRGLRRDNVEDSHAGKFVGVWSERFV